MLKFNTLTSRQKSVVKNDEAMKRIKSNHLHKSQWRCSPSCDKLTMLFRFLALVFLSAFLSTTLCEAFHTPHKTTCKSPTTIRRSSNPFWYGAQLPQASSCSFLRTNSDDDDDDHGNSTTNIDSKSKPMTLDELSRREQESSKKVFDALLLPDRIGKAFYVATIAFIVVGFILNLNGYGYVFKNNSISIDTLESRDFQIELSRSAKQGNAKQIIPERPENLP